MPDEYYECKLLPGDIVVLRSTVGGGDKFYMVIRDIKNKDSHYQVVDLKTEKMTEAFVGHFDTWAKVIANFNEERIQKCMTNSGLDGPAVIEEIKDRVEW